MDEKRFKFLSLDSIGHVFENLCSFFHIKTITGLLVVSLEWSFGKHQDMLAVVYMLLLLDTVTGVWSAARIGKISSNGFFAFSTKLVIYFILLLTSALVDKVLPVSFAIPLMSAFLAITESISILENVIKLGFPVPVKLLNTLKDVNSVNAKKEKSDHGKGNP